MAFLTGEKVALDPIEPHEADEFKGWLNDQEILQFLAAYLPLSLGEEEKWINELGKRKNDIVLGIYPLSDNPDRSSESNAIIGSIGLHNINQKDRNATLGIVIGNEAYRGKSFGTEAARLLIDWGFNQLNLHRINSGAFAFNDRSIKMHLKLGFKEEGRERQKSFKNGAYHDHVIFGLLREEWKK